MVQCRVYTPKALARYFFQGMVPWYSAIRGVLWPARFSSVTPLLNFSCATLIHGAPFSPAGYGANCSFSRHAATIRAGSRSPSFKRAASGAKTSSTALMPSPPFEDLTRFEDSSLEQFVPQPFQRTKYQRYNETVEASLCLMQEPEVELDHIAGTLWRTEVSSTVTPTGMTRCLTGKSQCAVYKDLLFCGPSLGMAIRRHGCAYSHSIYYRECGRSHTPSLAGTSEL